MYVCTHVWGIICMHACMHTCAPNLFFHITVHIFHMPLKKYGSHNGNIRHTANMLHGHIDPTFLHVHQNTSKWNIHFTCYCHICASNKYASQMLHICNISKLVHVHMMQLCKYLIWTPPQPTLWQGTCKTYISHYWHMSQNKCVCHIAYICPSVLLL